MRHLFLAAIFLSLNAVSAEGPEPKAAKEVCAACHGADGHSITPQYPSIGGQHEAYTAKQLADFKSGQRKSPIMEPIAKALDEKQIAQLAAYYAQKKPRLGTASDAQLVAKGEKLFRGGNPAEDVPACAGCHLPNGAGIPRAFPRLAGQYSEYIAAQLRAFRSEERANDPSKAMRAIASRMTEEEIRAVAEYISGLR